MVALETTFGMPDATDARAIDTTAIAALPPLSVTILRASFNAAASALKQAAVDNAELAWRGGTPPLVPGSVIGTDGSPAKQISGDITLEFIARGAGSGAAGDTFLGWLLSSSLARNLRMAATTSTGTYASVNTFTVSEADYADYTVGCAIAVTQADGTTRLCHVSDLTESGYIVKTVEAHGIPSGPGTATVRHTSIWYQPVDGTPDGESLVMQFAGRDAAFVTLAVGCRLKSLELSQADGMQVKAVAVVTCADGLYAAAAVIPQSVGLPNGVATSTPLRVRPAPCLISQDHSTSSAPWAGTVATFPVRNWSARIDVTLEPTPDQSKRCGISGYSVTSAMLSGSVTQAAPVTGVDFREVLRLSTQHTASLTAAGAGGAGTGLGVWMGSIQPTEDPAVTHEDARRTQAISWRAGDYAGDDPPTPGPEYANAPWLFALVS